MDENDFLKVAEKVIERLYKNSNCACLKNRENDKTHSQLTRDWVLKLNPNASISLQVAALGHDIDRTIEERRIKKEDFKEYNEYKRRHAIESADILCEELLKVNLDRNLVERIRYLVENHEFGGDDEANILKDADSLTFFNSDIYSYFKSEGYEKTYNKVKYTYDRLSKKAKDKINNISFRNEYVEEIFIKVISE